MRNYQKRFESSRLVRRYRHRHWRPVVSTATAIRRSTSRAPSAASSYPDGTEGEPLPFEWRWLLERVCGPLDGVITRRRPELLLTAAAGIPPIYWYPRLRIPANTLALWPAWWR